MERTDDLRGKSHVNRMKVPSVFEASFSFIMDASQESVMKNNDPKR